jgi:hypothetical protein
VKFGLQFELKNQQAELQPGDKAATALQEEAPAALPKKAEGKSTETGGNGEAAKPATVIALDNFRKKH